MEQVGLMQSFKEEGSNFRYVPPARHSAKPMAVTSFPDCTSERGSHLTIFHMRLIECPKLASEKVTRPDLDPGN